MQTLYCECGQIVYCESTGCTRCGNTLGFDPLSISITSAQTSGEGRLHNSQGTVFQLCANRQKYQACNGLVPVTAQSTPESLCDACCMNRTIPVLHRPENLHRWRKLEGAKRRMIAGLTALGLRVDAANDNPAGPMRFNFMEDKRSHPDVLEHFVSTGHKDGVITINLLEADEVQRVQQRERNGERYRTLLGHFRHEAGHYFYLQLVDGQAAFRKLFGDPSADYNRALQAYYNSGPPSGWSEHYISAYASSHPLEDWAEMFAHYLHIQDTLETASANGLLDSDVTSASVEDQLKEWAGLIVRISEINRSLGVADSYPFIINEMVGKKIGFVQQAISSHTGIIKQPG